MVKRQAWLPRYLVAGAWVYFNILFGWLALHFFTGDRLALVAIFSALAVYWFLPLPLVILITARQRRAELWIASGIGVLVFVWLWGSMFLPPGLRNAIAPGGSMPGGTPNNGPNLTVLTFNALGYSQEVGSQLQMLRSVAADVILLQEVSPVLADGLQTELAEQYPYQILAPAAGVTGMGVVSKYPIQSEAMNIEIGGWVGDPQVVRLEWQNENIRLVNFHLLPSGVEALERIGEQNQHRALQAQALAELAADGRPTILGGDANTTPLTEAYDIFHTIYEDAWQKGGYGLGHTFPGSAIPGSSRPQVAGIAVPQWLMRIDYVFHSQHFQTVKAQMAPFDDVSDHRGVIAVLKRIKAP